MKFTLKHVTENDYKFLYFLLKQRDKKENISHKKLPSYEKHCEFLNRLPYKEFYIIYHDLTPVGSAYLSKLDELGIHFLKKYRKLGTEQILEEFLPKAKFINVSPDNIEYLGILKNKGLRLIQHTYENILT
jgi:hypothetical protein